jgi:adenosylmethionine-8-amino-7-oxononanoate aminotransferase
MNVKQGQTYAVYARGTHGNKLLSIAIGEQDDIKAFFANHAGSEGLLVEPLKTQRVPANCAAQRNAMLAEKQTLARRLSKMEDKICAFHLTPAQT